MKEIIINVDNYNENSIKTIEGDNLSEVYKIYILKNKRRFNLTNKIAVMAYINEYGNKKSDILALNITNASQGEIELPITNVISSENGVYACQIAIYGENNFLEQTAPFSLIVENNIFSKISNTAINSTDFHILSEAIKTTSEYAEKLKQGTENIELQYASKLNGINEQLDNRICKGEVSVTDIDKNKGKLDQTYMTDEFLQQIAGGTPINAIPADKSITDEKLARPYVWGETGKNLFNKYMCSIGKYVNDLGELDDNKEYIASDFISVEPNEKYFLAISLSWGFQFCYYDKEKRFISKTQTQGGVYTIPEGCFYVRFTLKKEENLNAVQFEKGEVQTSYEEFKIKPLKKSIEIEHLNDDVMELINTSSYTVVCKKVDNGIIIGFKYNSNEDMRILFKPCGQSLLPQINNIYKFSNSNKLASLDFSSLGTLFQEATTDWVGPYIVRSSNPNGDKQDSWEFTGGWHGFNGDQTGSATARNITFKFYIDNVEITDNNVKCGNELKIVVVNRIQSTDTKKNDGSGREVLEETITYIVTPNQIKIEAQIKALENIKITKFYGIQTNLNSYADREKGEIFYASDDTCRKFKLCGYKNINAGNKTQSNCPEYIVKNEKDKIISYIDNTYSLGRRSYMDNDKPVAWTADYNKSYMVLIDGNCDLEQEEILLWKGGYKFLSLV